MPNSNDIAKILFPEKMIQTQVAELSRRITNDYTDLVAKGEEVVFICLLRGAFMFASDLYKNILFPSKIDFMHVSSYGNSTESSGKLEVKKDITEDIEGKHVILIEDILDSGLTLSSVKKLLEDKNPKSVEIAVLVQKDASRELLVTPRYVGFHCPNEFIVGYGLDYAENYRSFPYIGVLKPEVYS